MCVLDSHDLPPATADAAGHKVLAHGGRSADRRGLGRWVRNAHSESMGLAASAS